MTTALGAVLAGIFGALIGSFLNVVAYRLPRGESLSHPPSHCPNCGEPVKPYDNIPVLSWLLLRGRCRHCKQPISIRYPIVEAGTALLCALVVVVKGADGDAIIGIALVLLLVPVTLIDLDHHLIPNKITFPGFVLGMVLVLLLDPDSLVENLIASRAARAASCSSLGPVPAGDGDGGRQARVRARHLPRARRRARDVRRVHRGRADRRARSSPAWGSRRAARPASRSAPGSPSAASSACSQATRSSTGTSTPSPDPGLEPRCCAVSGASGVLTPPVMPQGGLRGCR